MQTAQYKAVCQSLVCNNTLVVNKQGAVKDVKRSAIDCPDCGHALMWFRVDKRQSINLVSKKGRNK